jgi:hypothetical protein
MTLPVINWIAVGICLFLGVLSGSLWYNPKTFFPMWWRSIGKSEHDQPGSGQQMGVVFGLTFVATAMQAIGSAIVLGLVFPAGYSIVQAVTLAVIVWAGAIAPTALVNTLFAGHQVRAWVITTSNHLLNGCLFALVFAVMQ